MIWKKTSAWIPNVKKNIKYFYKIKVNNIDPSSGWLSPGNNDIMTGYLLYLSIEHQLVFIYHVFIENNFCLISFKRNISVRTVDVDALFDLKVTI